MYTTVKTLSTTKQVELDWKTKFTTAVLDLDDKIFIVHKAFFTSTDIHPFSRVQIALLIQDNIFITVLSKYADFANIFSFNLITKFPKHIKIKDHLINLVED